MANSFLRMLFGGQSVTEPSYGGNRVPRMYSGDDSTFIRQGSPQERFRQYHAKDMMARTGSPIPDDARKRRIKSGIQEAEDNLVATPEQEEEANQKKKGMITGIGNSIAQMFAQADEPRQPLNLPQVMMGEQIPIIDPRYLQRRADGGPVKKKRPYLVGEDGPEVIIPEEDGTVIPNGRRNVDWNLREMLPQETVTETVTEPVAEPSVADELRGRIDPIQRRLGEGATKNADGTTMYGGKQYRKRNFKDALKSAGLGVLQALANAPANADLGSMLGRAIGGAGAGGVMGATMNNVDERMGDRMKLAQLLPQYEQAYGMERQKQSDEITKLNAESIRDDRIARQKAAQDKMVTSAQTSARNKLYGLKFIDPKIHAPLIKAAGLDPETFVGYDDRKKDMKQIAGIWYKEKTPNSGIYEQSGLPTDETKTLTDYVVEMPPDALGKREKRTFRVSQKDAANFSTQMSALGARLAQQESQFNRTMALNQAKFTEAKNQFAQQHDLRQKAFNALQEARAMGDSNKAQQFELELAKYDAMLEKMRQAMFEAQKSGELTDDQYKELEGFYNK